MAGQDAVTVPSARVSVTDDGVAGGLGAGVGVGVGVGVGSGVCGPADAELRHPLQPASLPARTPTMYVLALSALLMVMLVPAWLSDAALQLCRLSEV